MALHTVHTYLAVVFERLDAHFIVGRKEHHQLCQETHHHRGKQTEIIRECTGWPQQQQQQQQYSTVPGRGRTWSVSSSSFSTSMRRLAREGSPAQTQINKRGMTMIKQWCTTREDTALHCGSYRPLHRSCTWTPRWSCWCAPQAQHILRRAQSHTHTHTTVVSLPHTTTWQ
jgi:hypothetical protein